MIQRISREVIYENGWVNLYRDQIRFPDGRQQEHHLMTLPRSAVSVLVENDAGQLALVRIERYPTGHTSWELPAGRIEVGEDALAAARREALEETGFETAHHQKLASYYPLAGICSNRFSLVHCRASGVPGEFDRTEVSDRAWFSREDILTMIRSGEIIDGLALHGLFYYFTFGTAHAG